MPLYPYVAPTTAFVTTPPGWDSVWQAAKQASGTTPCWATMIGDSISQGGNASDWTTKDMTSLVRANLVSRYPNRYADFYSAGECVVASPGFLGTPPWVMSATGAVAGSTVGYSGGLRWTGAVANPFATFTTPYACTRIDLIWQNPFAAAGVTWTYTVDGGATQTITDAATVFQVLRVQITGLANTTHVIRLTTQSADNAIMLYGAVTYAGTTGVGFAKASLQGTEAAFWIDNNSTQPTNRYRLWQGYTTSSQNDIGFGFPSQPHLAIIEFGVLDCADLYAPSTFENGLVCIIRALRRGRQNCSIVMLAANNPDGITSDITAGLLANSPYWPIYVDVMKNVADAHNCAFVNVQSKWGEYGSALGFQSANVHPTDAGHADMAALLTALI